VVSRRPRPRPAGERGFTVIEVMIALTILLIGIAGLLAMQLTAVRANAFSRHATEAASLAEDKMEWLRTQPIADGTTSDVVNALGIPGGDGLNYTRKVTITSGTTEATIDVEVSWTEADGGDPHSISLSTLRSL
jgi:type IV pilus assembly protein PilV